MSNLYAPQGQPTFNPTAKATEQFEFQAPKEIVFSYTGRISGTKDSGLWSPPRRVRILEAAATMRVPAPVTYRLTTNSGQILSRTFTGTTVNVTNLAVTLQITGWLRATVTGSAGQDLVIAVRYIEILT